MRRLLRPPRSGRGFAVSLLAVGGLFGVAAVGGTTFQKWSETEGFCSRCHTMAPETAAHKLSVHRDVSCGECHVGPGVTGFVESKIKGASQMLQTVAGTYPKPIPPPDHNLLPSTKDTCVKCHSLSSLTDGDGPIKLDMHPYYREDQASTRQMVAVVVRPNRLGEGAASRGAHWHIGVKVEYASPEADAQKIDWMRVVYPDGRSEQFISRSKVGVSSDVLPEVDRIKRTETVRQMDCISCHNRVGHEFPSPGDAIDTALAEGKISRALPYVKREAVALLSRRYHSTADADRAIEGIRGLYAAKYPLATRGRKGEVGQAVDQMKLIYPLVAEPAMNMIAADYPNDLGHQSGPGCFRCHDGGHFKVGSGGQVRGGATVRWECTTCHTFPQSGPTISSVSLLGPPPDHQSKLWVFEHGQAPTALVPSAANSAFCTNCHSSGATKVSHQEMVFHHPQVIERAGIQACGYCHQAAFCARCHKKQQVLGRASADTGRGP